MNLLGTVATTFVIVGLFEELGWRGFLLPALQRRRPALDAALLVGLAWLPWHLPELLSDPSQRPPLPFAIIILAQSVILAWLYNSTGGSLPVVMLFHAGSNSFARFLLSGLERGTAYQAAWWALALLTACAALGTVWLGGRRSLAGTRRRSRDASTPARDVGAHL